MNRRERAVYVISVAAELAGVHPQTLRIYERKGLLEPARTTGGSRRYSEIDIERLRRISELSADGMNLSGIKRVMELEAENLRLRAELERLRADAVAAVDAAHRQHRRDLVPLSQTVEVWRRR
jgi:MerR family transcriptional regulator, heat shock protein HspR